MRIKVEEAIQRVQSLYSKGLQSKDTRLSDRHTYSALITARSVLLRQQFNKNQKISSWTYQTLPCVELMEAPVHECPCVPAVGCKVLRSKHPLPAPITGLDDYLIQSVTSMDGSIRFDKDTFENSKYSEGNKYTAGKPKRYFKNGYLYLTSIKRLKAVPVTGVFHDPVEVQNFPTVCNGEDCDNCCPDNLQAIFPIEGDLFDPLIKMAAQELIVMLKQMGEDKHANASDDEEIKGNMVHT